MKLIKKYHKLASTPITKKLADDLVKYIMNVDSLSGSDLSTKKVNQIENVFENINHQMREKGNNLWGLHSGVTRWTTHDKSAPKRTNGRIESNMFSTNYKVNQMSLEFCEEYI